MAVSARHGPDWQQISLRWKLQQLCAQEIINTSLGALWFKSPPNVFATALEKHYPLLLCEAIVHAFELRLGEAGLKFTMQTKMQHAARAATAEQTESIKLPPLVSPFSAKMVAFFLDDNLVWPLQMPNLKPCKLHHKFELGSLVNVKQFADQQLVDRVQQELDVCGIELNF